VASKSSAPGPVERRGNRCLPRWHLPGAILPGADGKSWSKKYLKKGDSANTIHIITAKMKKCNIIIYYYSWT